LHGDDPEAAAAAPGLSHGQCGAVERRYGSPRGVPGIAGLPGTEQAAPHGAPQSVGAHEKIAIRSRAASESRAYEGAVVFHAAEFVPGMQAGRVECHCQGAEQLGAVRYSHAPDCRIGGDLEQSLSTPVSEPPLYRGLGRRPNGGTQTQGIEGSNRIRHEADTGADFPQLRSLLIHVGIEPGPFERNRRRQAADAASDDEDSHSPSKTDC
jgi:hypothetical protein